MPSREWLRRVNLRTRYARNKTTILAKRRSDYAVHPSPKEEASRRQYAAHPSPKEACRRRSEAEYTENPSAGECDVLAATREWALIVHKPWT